MLPFGRFGNNLPNKEREISFSRGELRLVNIHERHDEFYLISVNNQFYRLPLKLKFEINESIFCKILNYSPFSLKLNKLVNSFNLNSTADKVLEYYSLPIEYLITAKAMLLADKVITNKTIVSTHTLIKPLFKEDNAETLFNVFTYLKLQPSEELTELVNDIPLVSFATTLFGIDAYKELFPIISLNDDINNETVIEIKSKISKIEEQLNNYCYTDILYRKQKLVEQFVDDIFLVRIKHQESVYKTVITSVNNKSYYYVQLNSEVHNIQLLIQIKQNIVLITYNGITGDDKKVGQFCTHAHNYLSINVVMEEGYPADKLFGNVKPLIVGSNTPSDPKNTTTKIFGTVNVNNFSNKIDLKSFKLLLNIIKHLIKEVVEHD